LDFRIPLMSDNILLSAIELAILENMVGGFGISILLSLQLGYIQFRFSSGHLRFSTSTYVGQHSL